MSQPTRSPLPSDAFLPSSACIIGIVLALAAPAAAQATALRDPTVPPAGSGRPVASPREPVESFRPEHLVTVDGKRYVMWRGHRYREGDSVQGVRIDRIEDAAVWVRTAGGTRKLPLYAGIEKRPR